MSHLDIGAGRRRRWEIDQLKKMLEFMVHASQCRSPHCQNLNCCKTKALFSHFIRCTRASGRCPVCKRMWYLIQLHVRECKESQCLVPECNGLKEDVRKLQQQSDSQRSADEMEMTKQRLQSLLVVARKYCKC